MFKEGSKICFEKLLEFKILKKKKKYFFLAEYNTDTMCTHIKHINE